MNGEDGEVEEKREEERRKRRKIEEDHEDGCIERDAGGEERATSRLRLEPLR